jgi:uncharacterized membrane protein HdeD (DUF308 family)
MRQSRERNDAWKLAAVASAAASFTMFPVQAFAQTATTLGGLIGTATSSIWQPAWTLLLGLGFLVGLWLVATGLTRLRDVGSHQGNQGMMDGVLRIIGGALLVGLPDTVNAGIMTFYDNVTGHPIDTANGTVHAVSDCLNSTSSMGGSTLTCVAGNVAANLVPVFVEVSFALLYLVGAVMIVHSIYTLATSHASGNRQQQKGWVIRIIIGVLICNVPYLMTAIEQTIGISNGTIMGTGFDQNNNDMLAYSYTGSGTSILAEYATLIGDLFIIMVMFGVVAVWRGIFFLRSYAEGNGRATLGQGLTHVIGGVVLANIKFAVCLLMNTFLGMAAGAAMGFCS